jgi:hypothetical protein
MPKVNHKDPVTGATIRVNMKQRPNDDVIFRRLEHSMPRDEMAYIMECANDERAQRLMKTMLDPRFRKRTLPWMARECGLSYMDVVLLIKNHHIGDGTVRMARHVPQAMEDVAIDSLSKEVTCGNCRGYLINSVASVPVTEVVTDEQTGRQTIQQKLGPDGASLWEKCLVCDGVGTLRKVGDADSRKILFETMGLTGRKGPLVVQQFNTGSMEDTVGAAHDVLDVPALKESNE